MTPSIAAACAAVEALVASGVRDVVLCPGSRSAPLGYAVRAAERAGRLRLQVRVDERSAGFLALGLAKLGGPPAAVVTTSGTAVANLHPAVLEAHHATVPLLLLTADRPAALRGAGANQTTVQPGIYGPSTRYAVDLAPGDDVASAVGTAVARARGEWGALLGTAGDRSEDGLDVASVGDGPAAVAPGPVHVNLQLVEPLVPTDADDLDAWAAGLAEGTSRLTDAEHRPSAVGAFPGSETVGTLVPPDGERLGSAGDLGLPARTLVLLGDLPERDVADAVLEWASTRAYPVLAEPFGRHPRPGVVPHGVVVAADAGFVDAHPPECVLVVGRLTLSRSIARLTRRRDVRLAVASAAGQPWRPPGRSAEVIDLLPSVGVARRDGMARAFEGVGGAHGGECPPRPGHSADHAAPWPGQGPAGADPEWAAAWFERGAALERAMAAAPPPWPSGLRVAREVVAALPDGAILFAGSSNAPRDLDIAVGPTRPGLDIVGNRGLAGIDGCVSTATGVALAHAGRPAYALVGDLTFLHDTNALLVGPDEPVPNLTVVVVNDDGGGIFETLEPGDPSGAGSADFERLFGTPTGARLEPLCTAYGVRYAEAASVEQLHRLVARRPDGLCVIEVRIDRGRTRAEHDEVMRLPGHWP